MISWRRVTFKMVDKLRRAVQNEFNTSVPTDFTE